MDDDSADFDAFLRKVARTPEVEPVVFSPGELVGPYTVNRRLGSGGMGIVYAATDSRTGADVALKLLRHSEQSADDLARFRREAVLLKRVTSPYVVSLLDFHLDDAPAWLALELLVGETLRDRMERRPINLSEALTFTARILEGISVAHQAGVIHRDIKPGNVFLTEDGGIKLLDFGLAKTAAKNDQPLTGIGMLLGTPHYMSPEQARGLAVDPRSDVFSVAVVCYEMLRGKKPFSEETTMDTLHAVAARRATLLDEVAGVPTPVAGWLDRCMQKRPEDRFQTAIEALEALPGRPR